VQTAILAGLILWLSVVDAKFTASRPYSGELNKLVRAYGPYWGVLIPTIVVVGILLIFNAPVLLGIILGIKLQLSFNQAIIRRIERRRSPSQNRRDADSRPSPGRSVPA
jgi:hypothetical protein